MVVNKLVDVKRRPSTLSCIPGDKSNSTVPRLPNVSEPNENEKWLMGLSPALVAQIWSPASSRMIIGAYTLTEDEGFASATPVTTPPVLSKAKTYVEALRVSSGTTASPFVAESLKMPNPLSLPLPTSWAQPISVVLFAGPVVSAMNWAPGGRLRSRVNAISGLAGGDSCGDGKGQRQ